MTEENFPEKFSVNLAYASPDDKVNADCIGTDGVFVLKHCVLWHLYKQFADHAHAAEQLLCSLHCDINKDENDTHTEEQPDSSHKEGSSEKQNLIKYLNFVLKDYSHPGESQQELNLFNQCIFRITCFKKALQWLSKNTQSDLKPGLSVNLKNIIDGLEMTTKHLKSLQNQDEGYHFCSVNDAAQSLNFDPSVLATQNSKLINSAKECPEIPRISVVSTGNEKSSVTKTGPHSFLVKLYSAWNSHCRTSPDLDNNTKFSVSDVTDHCSVEPKTPESFCFYGASTADYDLMISNNDVSLSDETDHLIISSLSENSESLVSSKQCANQSDMLSIKVHNIASASDDKQTDDKLNILESSVKCSLANATLTHKEGMRHDLKLPCSNSEAAEGQKACDSISASASTIETTAEESTLSDKKPSLSRRPRKTQSSKRGSYKNCKWRISKASHEITDDSNFPLDACQNGNQAMKKLTEPLKITLKKVVDDSSTSTERNSRKRKRKSSNVKSSQNSEVIDSAAKNTGPAVQQAPLISHLWKKHAVRRKNTSQNSDEAQSSSDTTNQNGSSLINSQAESHTPDAGTNNECQEKTVHLKQSQLPLDLSPKQSSIRNSALVTSLEKSKITPAKINGNQNESQIESINSALVNSLEKSKVTPEQINKSQNENQVETLHSDLKTQSFYLSISSVPPKNNLFLSSFQALTRASPVNETEISNNQSEQSVIAGQDVLLNCKHPSENTQLFDYYNTNMAHEGGVPLITSAENQLLAPKINSLSESRALQINKNQREKPPVNQHSLQQSTTAVSRYRAPPNRNGCDDQSNDLKLANQNAVVQYGNAQQFPHFQQRVDVSRSDETTYNFGAFNGVHALPNNMYIPSQNDTQIMSHSVPYVHPPVLPDTIGGIQIPNNGLAKHVPSAYAHQMIDSSKTKQVPSNLGNLSSNVTLMPENYDRTLCKRQRLEICPSRAPDMIAPTSSLGAMLNAAFSNATHMPQNVAGSYGRQTQNSCASRVPVIMGPPNANNSTNNLENMYNTSISNGTLIPRNLRPLALPSYGEQRPEMSASTAPMMNIPNTQDTDNNLGRMAITNGTLMPSSTSYPLYGRQNHEPYALTAPVTEDQTPHMGAQFAMTKNGTYEPESHLHQFFGRSMHQMDASSVIRQAPGKMYNRQDPNFAVRAFNSNNERQLSNNIMGTSRGNRRQAQHAGMTSPRGRKRAERVTNLGQKLDEFKGVETATIPNSGYTPQNVVNTNAGSSGMGGINVYSALQFPTQQFNNTPAENTMSLPGNNFDGNRRQTLQSSLHTSSFPDVRRWLSQPPPPWSNLQQMHQLQPSTSSHFQKK